MGGASGHSYSEAFDVINVIFAWDTGDNTYAITKLPLDQCRIKLDDEVITPTVGLYLQIEQYCNFLYSKSQLDRDQQQYLGRHFAYAVISCRSSDWPSSIELPLDPEISKKVSDVEHWNRILSIRAFIAKALFYPKTYWLK